MIYRYSLHGLRAPDVLSTDLMWDREIDSVAQYCQAEGGLDIGCGGRTINPETVTADIVQVEKQNHVMLPIDWQRLPMPDGTFPWVYSGHVLEHVADPKAFLAEALRVTRVGGHVCTVVPDTRFTRGQNTDATPHRHEWSPEDMTAQIFGCDRDHYLPWYRQRFEVPDLGASLVEIDVACVMWSFMFVLRKEGAGRASVVLS